MFVRTGMLRLDLSLMELDLEARNNQLVLLLPFAAPACRRFGKLHRGYRIVCKPHRAGTQLCITVLFKVLNCFLELDFGLPVNGLARL